MEYVAQPDLSAALQSNKPVTRLRTFAIAQSLKGSFQQSDTNTEVCVVQKRQVLKRSDRLRTQLSSCRDLPTLPGVAVELLACIRKSEVDLRELSDIICRDPALTAKILGMLNSPQYGLKKEVSSIHHASALLGLKNIQTVALSFALVRGMRKSDLEGFDYNRFWKRSILSAAAAQILGELRKTPNGEELFLSALLQDIGMLALQAIVPSEYGTLNQKAGKDHTKLFALERDEFGVDHAEVGGWLAEQWSLPEVFRLSIQGSHSPERIEVPEKLKSTIDVVAISGWLAEVWLDRSDSMVYLRGRSWSQLVRGMRKGEIKRVASQMRSWLSDLSALFELQVEDCKQAAQIMLESRDQLVKLNLETLQHTLEESDLNRCLSDRNQDLREKCFRDSITNLHNRAYLESFLSDQFVLDAAKSVPTSVIFCDIDHFKQVNDSNGHDAGDNCLAQLARLIKGKTRRYDHVVRWGGDEFVLVLTNTDHSAAVRIVERLLKAVQQTSFRLDSGASIPLRISVGCATHNKKTRFSCLEALVGAADLELIKARNSIKSGSLQPKAG